MNPVFNADTAEIFYLSSPPIVYCLRKLARTVLKHASAANDYAKLDVRLWLRLAKRRMHT